MSTGSRGPSRSRPAGGKRLFPKIDPPRLVAGLFALLIVCSLIVGGLGSVVFDFGLPGLSEDDFLTVDDESSGEFEQSLRDTIAKNPQDAAAMGYLANLLATKGETEEAIDWYERSLEVDPSNVRTRLDFGNTLAEAGRQADAEVQYVKAIELAGDDPEAHFVLAELRRRAEPPRTEEAIAGYRRVVETAPDSYYGQQAATELAGLGIAVATPGPAPAGTPTGA